MKKKFDGLGSEENYKKSKDSRLGRSKNKGGGIFANRCSHTGKSMGSNPGKSKEDRGAFE